MVASDFGVGQAIDKNGFLGVQLNLLMVAHGSQQHWIQGHRHPLLWVLGVGLAFWCKPVEAPVRSFLETPKIRPDSMLWHLRLFFDHRRQ